MNRCLHPLGGQCKVTTVSPGEGRRWALASGEINEIPLSRGFIYAYKASDMHALISSTVSFKI